MKFPEAYRADNPLMRFAAKDPQGGYFKLPHPDLPDTYFLVVATNGEYWQHVCVSIAGISRCPTWEEMCWLKSIFWEPESCVVQYHPPQSQYVNNHPFALHLFKPVVDKMPVPPSRMIGVRNLP